MGVKEVKTYRFTCDVCGKSVTKENQTKIDDWVTRYESVIVPYWDAYMKQEYKEHGYKPHLCCPDCKKSFSSWDEIRKESSGHVLGR